MEFVRKEGWSYKEWGSKKLVEDSAPQPQFVVYIGRVQVYSHRPDCLDRIDVLSHSKCSKSCVDSSK